ncbi:MAG: 1-acyl-sn-glycerol-3-phosphate acyltransferase [Myxococcota bacterium]|jgi:1-acyl-sn-glycerol-3-phosphate acyltransferase|nr:1-acyl-sn-glycerol-3-phosphate acyltransferase [Myxococcota bacterium]
MLRRRDGVDEQTTEDDTMTAIFDLKTLAAVDSSCKPNWGRGASDISRLMFWLSPGSSVEIENLDALPREPVIVAMNHTHFYDFLPLRAPLYSKGRHFVSWVKARAYKDPIAGKLLHNTGNVPICSRGYVIAADYFAVFGERMTNDQYRAVRDHVDHGKDLPTDDPRLERLATEGRDILGWSFNPSTHSYGQAIRMIFYDLMQLSLQKTAESVSRGEHVHIYPQGSIAARLIPGKIGTVEAALALGLPILPVGVSGCRETFIGGSPVPAPGQKIIVRYGKRLHSIPREEFPKNYRPFHPDDQAPQREKLEHYTRKIMEDLNELLEPDYQWASDLQSDAKTGVTRFF